MMNIKVCQPCRGAFSAIFMLCRHPRVPITWECLIHRHLPTKQQHPVLLIDKIPNVAHSKVSKMEEELKCSVCLDFFKSPVRITSCGHNYCQECLTGIGPIPWLCPECRTEQEQSPEQLIRNFFLERTVENFIESRKKICVVHDLPKKLRKYFNRFLSRFW